MFFESKFNLIQIGNFIFNILEIKGHPIKWETIIASHALNADLIGSWQAYFHAGI